MTVIPAIDSKLDLAERRWRGAYKTWRRLGRLSAMTVDETAATAVEFALAAPLLLGLLMPVVDLGLAYSQQIQVQQAAQAGAQYASLHPWNGNSVTAIENAMTSASRLALLPWSDPCVLGDNPAPCQTRGCLDGGKIIPPDTPPPPYHCRNGEPDGYYVVVNAQVIYHPLLLLPYSLIPNPTTLVAQATVRSQ